MTPADKKLADGIAAARAAESEWLADRILAVINDRGIEYSQDAVRALIREADERMGSRIQDLLELAHEAEEGPQGEPLAEGK